jgi:hypothetical protein
VSTQHGHEDPRWDSGATYGERITGQPSVWPTTARKEELRGEALRRAWIDASYRVRPEPSDASILADWDHEDCAICAKAAAEPVRGMHIPTLICSACFGILLWGLIGYVMSLVWRAVA